MRKKNSVKGFTLMEMVLAMLLSTIVISLVYTGYEIVVGQTQQYERMYERINDKASIYVLLQREFLQCKQVVQLDDERLLFETGERSMQLELKDSCICVHQEDFSDTLSLFIDEVEFSFQTQEVDEPNSLIDQLTIRYKDKGQPEVMCFSKQYDRKTLMTLLQNNK